MTLSSVSTQQLKSCHLLLTPSQRYHTKSSKIGSKKKKKKKKHYKFKNLCHRCEAETMWISGVLPIQRLRNGNKKNTMTRNNTSAVELLKISCWISLPVFRLAPLHTQTALLDESSDDSGCAFHQARSAPGCKGGESDMLRRFSVSFQLVSTPSVYKRESRACLGQVGKCLFQNGLEQPFPPEGCWVAWVAVLRI